MLSLWQNLFLEIICLSCWHWPINFPFYFFLSRCLASFTNSILQEENPSRECTIVRTAGKLTPFHFNKIPEEADDCNLQLASQRRRKKFNLKSNELLPPESYCPLCSSPLDKNSISNLAFENGHTSYGSFVPKCCSSCQFQILPKEPLHMEQFYSLLPQPITDRAKDGSCRSQRSIRLYTQPFFLVIFLKT